MTDFFLKIGINIVSAIAGALAGVFFRELIDFLKSRHSELSGEWFQVIYDENGEVAKKDKVECRHLGTRLKGSIKRIEPPSENHKAWVFEGYFLDDLFFGTFQTSDRRHNPGSYGTLQLRKVIFKGETTLEGFYVKSDSQLGSRKGNLQRSIIETSLRWERPLGK